MEPEPAISIEQTHLRSSCRNLLSSGWYVAVIENVPGFTKMFCVSTVSESCVICDAVITRIFVSSFNKIFSDNGFSMNTAGKETVLHVHTFTCRKTPVLHVQCM